MAKPPVPLVSNHSRWEERWKSMHCSRSIWIVLIIGRSSQGGNFAEHLDGALGGGELLEQLGPVLQAAHGVGEQPFHPSWIGGLGVSQVANSHFEVLAPGVDRSDHHFVATHKVGVDSIRGNSDSRVRSAHAG